MSFRISIIYIVSLLLSFALHAGEALLNGHKKNSAPTLELTPGTLNQLVQVSLTQYSNQAELVNHQAALIRRQTATIEEKEKEVTRLAQQREKDVKKIKNLRLMSFTATILAAGLALEKITTRYPDILAKLGTLLISKSPPSAG